MQYTGPVGPTREPKSSQTQKTDSKLYEKYLEYCRLEAQKAALTKYEQFIHSQILHSQSETLTRTKKETLDYSQKIETEIKEGLEIKWKKAQELQNLFRQMTDALEKKDKERTLNVLLQITESQVDPKSTAHPSYQKAFNQTMEEIFQRKDKEESKVEDLAMRLHMVQWGRKAIQQWGDTIPGMQRAALEKLENQITATEDNATPFQNASQNLFTEIHGASEQEMKSFISEDSEQRIRNQLLKFIEDSMMSPAIKAALNKGEKKLKKESSESEKDHAAREIAITVGSREILKEHIIDKSFESELEKLRNAVWHLKQITNLSPSDKKLLESLEKELDDAEAEYNDPDKQRISTLKLLDVLEGVGRILNFTGGEGRDVNAQHRQQALERVMESLDMIKSTADRGCGDIQKLINDLDAKMKDARSLIPLIDEMQEIINRINAGTATREDYAKLMEDYLKLNKAQNLSPDLQQKVNDLIKAIQKTTVMTPRGDHISLIDMMAACYIQKNAPKGPEIQIEDINKWINEFSATLDKNFPESSDAKDAIKKILHSSKPGEKLRLCIDPYSGDALFSQERNGPFKVNPNYAQRDHVKFDNLDNLATVVKNSRSYLDEILKKWSLQRDTLVYSLHEVEKLAAQSQDLAILLDQVTKAVDKGKNLGEIFRDYILGKYTAYLEIALKKLAFQLAGRTFASKAYGDAASKITNWANVSNTVDPPAGLGYNSWFKKYDQMHPAGDPDPNKKFKPEDVKKYAQAELDSIKDFKQGAVDTEASLKASIAKADEEAASGKITKEDAEARKKDFQKEIENLHKTVEDLDNLRKSLEPIISDLPTDPEKARQFIKDRIDNIGKNETYCVNGNREKGSMGMNTFQTHLMDTSKDFAGQGERLQMQLGQTFSNMQMNYATITSCMQLLNRMISSPIMNVRNG